MAGAKIIRASGCGISVNLASVNALPRYWSRSAAIFGLMFHFRRQSPLTVQSESLSKG
jgi:hypothetical protein